MYPFFVNTQQELLAKSEQGNQFSPVTRVLVRNVSFSWKKVSQT
jgi:hypothetical protein